MRKLFVIALLSSVLAGNIYSQTAMVRGKVTDGNTGENMEGVVVAQPPANGTTTNISGNYEIKVTPGEVTLIFSFVLMKADTEQFTIKPGENKVLNVSLSGTPSELQTVVVTENRMGEKIQKISQSIEVMTPQTLESNNVTNMENAVTKIPGVSMIDGQMSVRGGSGYAYGAGSRVLLVVDEMPLMTADRDDIKWPFVPIENVQQMELVKGAASVQYGASALDGVLEVSTIGGTDSPNTRLIFAYEGYGKPPVDSFKWWNRNGKFFQNPNGLSVSFAHRQKVGDVEFVISGMMKGSQSYLQGDYEDYVRYNGKLIWRPHKVPRLTFELQSSILYDTWGFQFWWQDAGHPYLSGAGVNDQERYFYAYIDPKIQYIDKKGDLHKIYARFYRQIDIGGLDKFWVYQLHYTFQHDFGRMFRLLAGAENDHYVEAGTYFGNHQGDKGGGFAMGQFNYKFLTLSAGIREEYIRLDSALSPSLPVFRIGANFTVRKYNYLRISFGQSERFPGIAEIFTNYNLGGLQIIPNPKLGPERGNTAEIGYKRSLKIGKWLGYFDAAAFWTQFKNMIEFVSGFEAISVPPYYEPTFQAQNVGPVRIFGWEFTLYGEGYITKNAYLTTSLGYTYFYGAYLNNPTDPYPYGDGVGTFIKNAFTHYVLPTAKNDGAWDSITSGMLRYRYPHQLKADINLVLYKRLQLGTSVQYYSYMTQLDDIFNVAISGVDQYRTDTRNKGDWFWDLRTGYIIFPGLQLNFLVKNVLNNYTILRPARPDPPRSYTVQMIINLGGKKKQSSLN